MNATVGLNGSALKHASKKVVLAAVADNPFAIVCASDDLANNRDVIKSVVRHDLFGLKYMPLKFRTNKKFVMAAVRQNGCDLQYASDNLQMDTKVRMAAFKQLKFDFSKLPDGLLKKIAQLLLAKEKQEC